MPHPLLPAAAVADAVVRMGLEVRFAPAAIRRLLPGEPVAGPAVPCVHRGSVDVFLEAIETAPPGGILVIDNEGREDEGCIGDLTVGEARAAGLAGFVVDGLHRDEAQLRALGLPIWSRGPMPFGPRGVRPAPAGRGGDPATTVARIGDILVSAADLVVADDDGVVFVPADRWSDIASIAAGILETEMAQAEKIGAGTSLREQLRFGEYLARRAEDPSYDLRRHLRDVGGAIET